MKLLKCSWILLLTSCRVSMPLEQQVENIMPPPCLEKSVDQGLASGYFTLGHFPEKKWWEEFHSEELSFLIHQALLFNPTISQLESRVQLAKQEAIITRSSLFPLVFFNAEETSQHLSKTGLYKALNPRLPINVNLIDLNLSFDYEFDFWGKNAHHFLASLGRERAQLAEKFQVELITSVAVAQTYFALKSNLVKKELYIEKWKVRQQLEKLSNLLQRKALSSVLPPLQVEEKRLQAEQMVASIEAEIAQNIHRLNILLGRGPNTPLCLEESLSSLPSQLSLPETLSLDLISRRPDLRAQIWEVEAQGHEVGAAIADFFPNVNISALLGLESVFFSRLFRASSATWGVTPALHLPIFTAGAIRANVGAQKALFDAAVFTYNELVLRSAQEVADLVAIAKEIFQKKEMQEAIVGQSRSRYMLTHLRQQKGIDSLLAVYQQEEEWIEKEVENVDLLYAQYLATTKLIQALGGGYCE